VGATARYSIIVKLNSMSPSGMTLSFWTTLSITVHFISVRYLVIDSSFPYVQTANYFKDMLGTAGVGYNSGTYAPEVVNLTAPMGTLSSSDYYVMHFINGYDI
jgi:hypothetical protein